MINPDHKKLTALFASFAAAFASGAVFAGGHLESTAPAAAISSEELEQTDGKSAAELLKLLPELVTTARRGEESTLDVPLSISTLTGAELQAAQIQDLEGIATLTPGFSFQNYFGQDLSVPTIRGVSQVDIFGQPNAPFYINGIYVSSKTGLNLSFQNVERVEVLRGPQPAYFGFNAFSGAVNLVTRKPDDEFRIDGEVTFGTDERRKVMGAIEGGLVEGVLAARVSAMYDDFGGTYDNANPNVSQDIGGRKYKTAGLGLYFTPTDTFDAFLDIYVSDDSIDPDSQSQVPANCEPRVSDGKLANFCGNVPSVEDDELATIPGETGQNREVFRASLELNWDAGFGTFSSLTGVSETKNEIVTSTDRGADGSVFAYQSVNPGFIPGSFEINRFSAPVLQPSPGKDKLEDFSQELRFTSPRDRQFRYTVGGYYRSTEDTIPILEGPGFWSHIDNVPADAAELIFPGSGIFDLCPCIEFVPGVGVSAGFGGFIFADVFTDMMPGLDYTNEAESDLWAGFFGLEYDINDQWTGYLEGRYTDFEEKSIDNNPATDPNDRVTKFDDDFFNWRASIEYQPDEFTTYYASVATGTKQGGLEVFTPETVNPDPDCTPTVTPDCVDGQTQTVTFDQEEITTYEVGYKALYNEGDTIVDASLFYSDWQDIVLPQIVEEVNGKEIVPNGVSGNIGKAIVAGGELSITQQFTENFTGVFNTSYNRAKLDEGKVESFTDFPSFAPNGNMYGQTLSRQPEFQANLVASYQDELRGMWDWYTRFDVNYQSRWYVGLPNQGIIPGRFRSNWRIGLDSDMYTVELWVTNLFDDDTVDAAFRDVYLSNALPDGTQGFDTIFPFRLTVTHPERRAAGITLRGRF